MMPRFVTSRISALAAVPLACLIGVTISSCGDNDSVSSRNVREFVGAIPNADPGSSEEPQRANELVAVVVDEPNTSGTRAIRAYVCDGEDPPGGSAEWFTGTLADDAFDLGSASGNARIQGQLAEDAVTGTVELPDGRILNFRALPATAGGGLYEISLLPGGVRRGASASGAEFEEQVVDETVDGEVTTRTVRGTIHTLEGQTIPFTALERALNDDGSDLGLIIIVLPNSENQAGRSVEITSGTSSNYSHFIGQI